MTTSRQPSRREDALPQTPEVVKWDRNGLYMLVEVPDPAEPGKSTEQRRPVLGPCTKDPSLFDLDHPRRPIELSSDEAAVNRAIRICGACPFQRQCEEWRDWRYSEVQRTQSAKTNGAGASLIWAGQVRDGHGKIVPPERYSRFLRDRHRRRVSDQREYEAELPEIERRLAELLAATAKPEGPSLSDARPGRRRSAEARRNTAA